MRRARESSDSRSEWQAEPADQRTSLCTWPADRATWSGRPGPTSAESPRTTSATSVTPPPSCGLTSSPPRGRHRGWTSTDLSRNVTDVDDVLTRAAESRGRYFDEFALTQEFMFQQHMTTLRVAPPTSEPRARHHVARVQQLAHALQRDADKAARKQGRAEAAWERSPIGQAITTSCDAYARGGLRLRGSTRPRSSEAMRNPQGAASVARLRGVSAHPGHAAGCQTGY